MFKEMIYINKPKYLIIKDILKEKILVGAYPSDSKIPSEIDLAKQYHVSRHTIRKALSNLVSEGFLIKVHGSGNFVSNAYLKDNSNNSNNTIGIIMTYLSDYIFPSIVRGIEKELHNQNYSLIIASTQNNVTNEKKILNNMLQHNIAGLIVEPTKSNLMNPNLNYYLDMHRENIPILMLHGSYEELNIPFIGIDDVGAGEIATQHLIDLGHKEIAIIIKTDDVQGKKRFTGYINALQREKLTYKSNHLILFDTESKDQLSSSIHKMLDNDDAPTAIVCYNDQIAVEVLKEMKQLNLSVPANLSIVSHDDSLLSTSVSDVNITSIEHPKEIVGRDAAKWLINKIENPDTSLTPIVYPPKLINRGSTKELNKN